MTSKFSLVTSIDLFGEHPANTAFRWRVYAAVRCELSFGILLVTKYTPGRGSVVVGCVVETCFRVEEVHGRRRRGICREPTKAISNCARKSAWPGATGMPKTDIRLPVMTIMAIDTSTEYESVVACLSQITIYKCMYICMYICMHTCI